MSRRIIRSLVLGALLCVGLGTTAGCIPDSDEDDDGILNLLDNCPNTPNADQADSDGNGVGDVCDIPPPPDNDEDDVPDWIDNCPSTFNPTQADGDGDGIGDACDMISSERTYKVIFPFKIPESIDEQFAHEHNDAVTYMNWVRATNTADLYKAFVEGFKNAYSHNVFGLIDSMIDMKAAGDEYWQLAPYIPSEDINTYQYSNPLFEDQWTYVPATPTFYQEALGTLIPVQQTGFDRIVLHDSGGIDDGEGPGTLIETISVPSWNRSGVSSSTILEAGLTYWFLAEGTWRMGGSGQLEDAEWWTYPPDYPDWDENSSDPDTNYGDLEIDRADYDWLGCPQADPDPVDNFHDFREHTFSPSHRYWASVVGQGAAINLSLADHPSHYGDNSGSLTISIYASQ